MRLEITDSTPALLTLQGFEDKLDQVRESLSYRDLKVEYTYRNFKSSSSWLRDKMGEEKFDARLKELKAGVKKSVLTVDGDGTTTTLSGLSSYLSKKTGLQVENKVKYPQPASIPWHKEPEFTAHPYQDAAEEALFLARHARVEMGTGLGKSFIVTKLLRRLGLQAVVMAPNTSIAQQLHEELVIRFGAKRVGAYFDKKKDFKKLITVGNAQSLTRIQPGSEAWGKLSQAKVFIADESHLCPAATLARVCTSLCVGAPYRFFFSATQLRNDGLDLVLDGITGPTVYKMTVREGIEQGYLAPLAFRMLRCGSKSPVLSKDTNVMTRAHLYYNSEVVTKLAHNINMAAQAGLPVLVLVKEVEQFTVLLPHLRHSVGFAHGTLDKENIDKVPSEYRDSQPNALVKEFNELKIPILVGTTCISTGTNIKAVKFLVNWQGMGSEVAVFQATGRATRLDPPTGKTRCFVLDVDVRVDIIPDPEKDAVHRQAEARRGFYREINESVRDLV